MKLRHLSLCVFMASALAGCTGMAVTTSRPVSLVQGPPITDIYTPFDKALSCLNGQLRPDVTFSVGAILDQTGKDAITNGGSGKYISQGAGDMVQSALFRAGVTLLNRRDPRILETEVKWGLRSPKSIAMSNYFITGSINSLDFIPGGGFDVQVAGVGPQYSQTRIIVGLDLSLTDANTSRVVANVSLQKQIAAQDYGVGAGRFAGLTLLNVQMGAGEREATNFALRQMLNLATFELLNQVMDPSLYVQCRDGIPPEYGTLNATRSAVLLSRYKKKLDAAEIAKNKPVAPVPAPKVAEAPAPRPVAAVPAPAPDVVEPAKVEAVAVVPRTVPAPVAAEVPKAPVPAPVPVAQAAVAPPVAAPAKLVVAPAPVAAAKPAVVAPAPAAVPVTEPAAKPVTKSNEPVFREFNEAEPVQQSKPAVAETRGKLAVAKPQPTPKPAPAPVVAEPKPVPKPDPVAVSAPVQVPASSPVSVQPEPKSEAPVLREAAEETPVRKKSPAVEPRAKLAQVKPALSPAPESAAEVIEPVQHKPAVKVKPAQSPLPEPVAIKAKPAQSPLSEPVAIKAKPAQSPLPEPVAVKTKPAQSPLPEPVAVNAKPGAKPKAMSKPTLLDGDLSVMSTDDSVAPAPTAPTAKPVPAQSREKTASNGKKPATAVAKAPAAEAKTKPAFVSATSKSNTVAFVSSDDDGGKYWSDETESDARINAPLH